MANASSLGIEPTLHHRTGHKDLLCVRRWSDAGPAGRVRSTQVHCREPKQGSKRFILLRRRFTLPIWLYYLSMISPDDMQILQTRNRLTDVLLTKNTRTGFRLTDGLLTKATKQALDWLSII